MIIKLYATGPQDYHLYDEPQRQWFDTTYKTSQHFASVYKTKPIRLQYDDFTEVEVPRFGHLLHKVYIMVKLPELVKEDGTYVAYCNNVVRALFKKIDLVVGGINVDTHDGHYLDLKDELTTQYNDKVGFDEITGKKDLFAKNLLTARQPQITRFLPLSFWFNNKLNQSFPISLVKYNTTVLRLQVAKADEIVTYDGNLAPIVPPIVDAQVIFEYIVMEDKDFQIYKDIPQKHLIEQVQKDTFEVNPGTREQRFLLKFNHPVKRLIWFFIDQSSITNNDHFLYSNREDGAPFMESARFSVDGSEAIPSLSEEFYRIIQRLDKKMKIPTKYVYTIEFCERDDEVAGSLNFSRINEAALHVTFAAGIPNLRLVMYAENYNVVYVKDGYAALGFSS